MKLRFLLVLLFGSVLGPQSSYGQTKEPVIDMHIHAHERWEGWDTTWFPQQFKRPESSEQLMLQTIAELKKNHVVIGVANGYTNKMINKWKDVYSGILTDGFETSGIPTKANF